MSKVGRGLASLTLESSQVDPAHMRVSCCYECEYPDRDTWRTRHVLILGLLSPGYLRRLARAIRESLGDERPKRRLGRGRPRAAAPGKKDPK